MNLNFKYKSNVAGLFFFCFFFTQLNFGQVQIKGIVKGKSYDKVEVLNGANVYLKGTSIGTSTDKKGEFTFPKELNVGDIIEISYLGFLKKSIKISNESTFLTITLEEDDNEMLGAINSNKRFTSKRFKKKN